MWSSRQPELRGDVVGVNGVVLCGKSEACVCVLLSSIIFEAECVCLCGRAETEDALQPGPRRWVEGRLTDDG